MILVGIIVFAPLIRYLCTLCGWQATLGIFALWGPISIACSCLMKPLVIEVAKMKDETSSIEIDKTGSENKLCQMEMVKTKPNILDEMSYSCAIIALPALDIECKNIHSSTSTAPPPLPWK